MPGTNGRLAPKKYFRQKFRVFKIVMWQNFFFFKKLPRQRNFEPN